MFVQLHAEIGPIYVNSERIAYFHSDGVSGTKIYFTDELATAVKENPLDVLAVLGRDAVKVETELQTPTRSRPAPRAGQK